MSNGKAEIFLLIAGLIKKTLYKLSKYFAKPCRSFEGYVKIKLDLSSYAIKAKLKNATRVDTSKLADSDCRFKI